MISAKRLSGAVAWATKHTLVRMLFGEDGWSTAIEQEGYEENWRAPSIDPHPAIRPSYQLTIRKWEEHPARCAGRS